MSTVSKNGGDIYLNRGERYYVIDALYLDQIRTHAETLDVEAFDNEVQEKIFPFTDAPFAKILVNDVFKVSSIKRFDINDDRDIPHGEEFFATDTGLLVLAVERVFQSLAKEFDYNKLIDETGEVDVNYLDKITAHYGINDVALLLAPGLDSGYEFEGSGLYKIDS